MTITSLQSKTPITTMSKKARQRKSLADLTALLSDKERSDILSSLSPEELQALEHDWKFWGRPDQQLPPEPWSIWLLLAGRGFGKSRTGSETIRQLVEGRTPLGKGRYKNVAIIGETAADVRDVMIEGPSGILTSTPKAFRPLYEPSKRRLTWPNGATAGLYNATEPDQLRGPQFDLAWLDELAKWRYMQETWDQLQFGMRLGTDPKQIITTTPKPLPLIREIMKYSYTHVTRGSTYDNEANLARSFFYQVVERYAGTRLGRQEIDAEILEDVPGAMFSRDDIEKNRRISFEGELNRIVVAVDPSGTAGSDHQDAVGIVVAGKTRDKHAYIIDDRTINASPKTWAGRAVDAFHEYDADEIIAEANFGGEMVRSTIQSVDPLVPVKIVHASRGKHIRAQPVASLYEQGRVHHIGQFSELEDQLAFFTHEGYMGVGSPNNADAAVWALTDLLIKPLRKATSSEI